jgi:hypothetical protein
LSEHAWIHLAKHLVPGLVELREEIAELLQNGKEIPAEKLAELRHKKAGTMRLRFGRARSPENRTEFRAFPRHGATPVLVGASHLNY